MSVNIATMGMFSSGIGSGNIITESRNTGGGVLMVEDKKPKPIIKVINVLSNEIISSKNVIEITSITSGD